MHLESYQLEEYKGHKFFVEYVGDVPYGNWFRIHMLNGVIHDITIDDAGSFDETKQKLLEKFKNNLNSKWGFKKW